MTQRHISHPEGLPKCAAGHSARMIGPGHAEQVIPSKALTLPLAGQSFDIRFDSSNPQLHSIAFACDSAKPARLDQHWLPIDLCGGTEETGFVLRNGQHNAVAANAAAKGAACCGIGHSGSSMNGRENSTRRRIQWEVSAAAQMRSSVAALLSSAISGRSAGQLIHSHPLRLFEYQAAGPEGRHVDLYGAAPVHVHRKQFPLRSTTSPDVRRIRALRSGNRKRDAMERLRCLLFCHFNQSLYSQPESANRSECPQGRRAEAVSMENPQ